MVFPPGLAQSSAFEETALTPILAIRCGVD